MLLANKKMFLVLAIIATKSADEQKPNIWKFNETGLQEKSCVLALQCSVPQNFKLRPMRYFCFDHVKACEGVFLLCFLVQIVTWQYNPNLLD